ncbi:MAG: PilZ domain-containing protein [Phycisphaeraceae bacterium]
MSSSSERRHDARLELTRPVKVKCLLTGRYLPGRSRNLSSGGALLEIDHPSLLVPGQRILIGVAQTKQDVLLAADEMAPATVVRSAGLRGTQTVAVQFDHRQQLAMTA